MMWVRLDCAAPHHHKLLTAGPEAAWLWMAGLCYANLHATDGVIPSSALSALYPTPQWTLRRVRTLATELVRVGLWHLRSDGGWDIHGYAEYQQPALRAEVESRKGGWREKKRAQRAKMDSSDLRPSSIGREIAPGKSAISPAPSAGVPEMSPGDTPIMSPEDASEQSPADVIRMSSEPSPVVSPHSGPVRSEPSRPVSSSRETRTPEVSAETATAAQRPKRAQELIEVLRARCPGAIVFAGTDTPSIREALDQRLSEVAGPVDRERFELLALWYAAGAMAWRQTPLGLRELSTTRGRLAEHFEAAAKWDREGRRSLRGDSRSTHDRALPPSHEGEASAGDPLLAQARQRRGSHGDRQ